MEVVEKIVCGEKVKLTLKLKQEFKDKEYNLFTVCKVVGKEKIPLYNETFTHAQVIAFYENPTRLSLDTIKRFDELKGE